MSLKLRLALWYAGLTTAVVFTIVATAYVIHGRSQYLDVDRNLLNDAGDFVPILELLTGGNAVAHGSPPPTQTTFLRLYDALGHPIGSAGEDAPAPVIDAVATLRAASDPAYDAPLRWLPGGRISAPGAFATARDGDGNRVRLYALPVSVDGQLAGYVQTWTSLEVADRSMARFRGIMFGLAVGSVIAVGLLGRSIAGLALQPVSAMIATAKANATLRGFGRRVPEPRRASRDELSTLARTFNEMLDALQDVYVAQQRFVADAAHELRAPLTAVRGNIELLGHVRNMPEADREEALADLERESLRLSRLVEQLLQLARSDAGQPIELRAVELDAVLLQVIAGMRALPGAERIQLAELVPVAVLGDADRLRQLATIVLDNALKYSPAAGAIAVSLTVDGAEAVLSVRDNGVGIAPADLSRVFERFFRADPARSRDPGGSGLGLAIAQSITEQHHGGIALESELGRGTTVRVRLPVQVPSAALPLGESQERRAADRGELSPGSAAPQPLLSSNPDARRRRPL